MTLINPLECTRASRPAARLDRPKLNVTGGWLPAANGRLARSQMRVPPVAEPATGHRSVTHGSGGSASWGSAAPRAIRREGGNLPGDSRCSRAFYL